MLKNLMLSAFALATLTSGAVAAPAPEVFGALPAIQAVRVSPSGKYFAIIQNLPGQTAVKTFDVATSQMIGGIATAKQQKIVGLRWHSDDRIILSVEETVKLSESIVREDEITSTRVCQMMSIPRDGKNPVKLSTSGMARDATFICDPLTMKGPEPNTILVEATVVKSSGTSSISSARAETKVHKIDVLTGSGSIYDEVGSRSTYSWGADRKGKVRLRYDYVAGEIVVYARLDGSSDWVQVHRQPAFAFEREGPGAMAGIMNIQGFAADPNQLYVTYWPGDREALGRFDLRTRQITTVYSDAKYDVEGAVFSDEDVIGAAVVRENPEQIFFDEEWKKIQSLLLATYPGHRARITSSSNDRGKLSVYLEGPTAPSGAHLVVDLRTNEALVLGANYPSLNLASTGDTKYVTYTARDGMKIDAYLTVPRSGGKNLPAIVVPHGGPEARDGGGFDLFAQFFASRGYAVLQPQFRGSSGFGRDFVFAGRKQWGRKMQDDVSDGVKYMTSNGIADPTKVCIMGWSYGGYAALAGATLTPELYRCVIAGAGVGDLVDMLVWSAKYNSARYWRKNIGDSVADKAAIDAVSPAKHADKVKAPILLIHGDLDDVVPIRQSEIMADALKAAGKPYEFVRLTNENHNIAFPSTRTKTMQAMDAFLAKHNPAR